MASIIDAFRETYTDKFSFVKILVFTAPLYYSYALFVAKSPDFMWIASLTIFLLFGFVIKITGRVLNDADSVMPSLNPFPIIWASLKGIVAVGPYAFISCYLANYFCSFLNTIPWFDITMRIILWLVAAAVICTSFLMFITKENIVDAYRIKLLSDKAGDLIVSLAVMVIQFIVINAPTSGFVGYTIYLLFGAGEFLNFFIAFAITFNIIAFGHFMAQVHYDVLEKEIS